MSALFTYGTLALPEVMGALVGRALPSEGARLADHERRRVRGAVYPAARARAGATTPGRLYRGLTAADLRLLDRFEGPLYERRRVRVATDRGGRPDAFAYVLRPGQEHVLAPEPWDPERFRARHLAPYLAMCRAFRDEEGRRAARW